jgi:myosin heavy subunit
MIMVVKGNRLASTAKTWFDRRSVYFNTYKRVFEWLVRAINTALLRAKGEVSASR